MSIIRTVLGDIPPADLGVCYAHEHVIIDASYATTRFPDFRLDSVENAVKELTDFHQAGGRAMVDSMPCGAGRNVLKLAEVSRGSGVHIVCPTGLHLAKYYPEGHWGARLDPARLADLFVADIEQGVDANDYTGPDVQRTPHRAGVIKVAAGRDALDDYALRTFEAAAIAHARTGCPILTHTEQGTAALEQIETLSRFGVAPNRVVLSHTDRKPDLGYHREILSAGAFVEYDSAFRWNSGDVNPTRDLVVAMAEDGFIGQLMLGMDAARPTYWKHYGGSPGLTFLLESFVPQLIATGLLREQIGAMFIGNPARAYAVSLKVK